MDDDRFGRSSALLSWSDDPSGSSKRCSFFRASVKWLLKLLLWGVFISWIALMVFFPLEVVSDLFDKYVLVTDGTVFGVTGSLLLAFSCPVFMLAILGVCYLNIRTEKFDYGRLKPAQKPRFRLWTFPFLVDGPFGVVSAAEFIGILVFILSLVWIISVYTFRNWRLASQSPLSFTLKCVRMLELEGLRFGMIGLFCLAFLFLPIARGSVLLRLIDISFDRATRYHVWLGHLTMFLFTLHGLSYTIVWSMQGKLVKHILQWENTGVAHLAGVITLAAGLLMWLTSLQPVRKHCFELFFCTHQLYVIFIIFLALHVGDFLFSIAAGGIFLFMLDRFLRFCQSRKTVEIISATSHPCGSMELVLSKPSNLRYNALSFIFLQVRELSWLQWHPFSVSSSPLDDKNRLSILIKPLGSWTAQLQDRISDANHSQITASIEGPYGHELPCYLMYEQLVLVAGGIGISPFLAILSDTFHRINEGMPCITKRILVVWAVKRSDELSLLSTRDMKTTLPFFSDVLKLQIQVYITGESEPSPEEGNAYAGAKSSFHSISGRSNMSIFSGTGSDIWLGIYVTSSIFGFLVILSLLDVLYIKPFGISFWWYKGLLLLGCMSTSVAVIGGCIIFLWNRWETRNSLSKVDVCTDEVIGLHPFEGHVEDENRSVQNLLAWSNIQFGCRPDLEGIFGSVGGSWGEVDIGVLVCGPASLQSSAAKALRSHNKRRRGVVWLEFRNRGEIGMR